MHRTKSFFPSISHNPYFHPGSLDLACLLGYGARLNSSGGSSAMALAIIGSTSILSLVLAASPLEPCQL
uniref:Uncharacterized protein n=1 Tax=Arundo donax TaxID=35708 RepID=A0A0A9DSZ3_ARUDO